MLLYLKEEPVSGLTSLVRTVPGQTLPAGGDILNGQTQTYAYAPPVQNEILRNSRVTLTIPVVVNGTVTITPKITIIDNRPDTPDLEMYGGDARQITGLGGATTLVWQTVLGVSEPLENRQIVVSIKAEGSPVTLGTSTLDVDLREGSYESFALWSTATFTHFQKTEKIYLWHEVDVKERITIPLWHRVRSVEDVRVRLWHEVAVIERISIPLYHEVSGLVRPVAPSRKISNLRIDDAVLFDGPYMRRVANLEDIIEGIEPPPPLEIPTAPERTTEGSPLAHAAESFMRVVDMLVTDEDQVVPHGNLEIFEPSGLYGGTMIYDADADEWRLPRGHEATESYYVQFPTLTVGQVSKTLFFMLRQRDEGAIVEAFLRGEPGRLVFRGRINAGEEVRVWAWTEAAYPFDVALYANNPSASGPGFSGRMAAMMTPL